MIYIFIISPLLFLFRTFEKTVVFSKEGESRLCFCTRPHTENQLTRGHSGEGCSKSDANVKSSVYLLVQWGLGSHRSMPKMWIR